MKSHADKKQDSRDEIIVHKNTARQGISNYAFQIKDNRSNSASKKRIQNKIKNSSSEIPIQKKENNTGLPDNLKSGIENLSGYAMDDVKVHYNSDKPTQLNAHAYAQGTDIHLASGQEKHLPHEAWHVVQQMQGRVKPTTQLKGKFDINDDVNLEKEADVMGMAVFQVNNRNNSVISNTIKTKIIQRWPINQNNFVIERETRWLMTLKDFLNFRVTSMGFKIWIDNIFFDYFLGDLLPEFVLGLLEAGVRNSINMREVEFWLTQFKSYRLSLNPQRESELNKILEDLRNRGIRFVRFEDLMICIKEKMGFRQGGMISQGDQVRSVPWYWLNRLNTRKGEEGVFNKKKGDHASAHVLFRTWIKNAFIGVSIEEVSNVARQLRSELIALFRAVYNQKADEELEYQVSIAWTRALEIFNKQLYYWTSCVESGLPWSHISVSAEHAFVELCIALMNMRNSVPYSAMEFGGTGGGEGHANTNIFELNKFFRRGIDSNNIEVIKFSIEASLDELIQNALKLVDIQRIHSELSEGNLDSDLALLPGRTGDRAIDMENLIFLHLESLRMAYPSLWSGLATLGFLDRFINGIRDKIYEGPGEDYIQIKDMEIEEEDLGPRDSKKRKR